MPHTHPAVPGSTLLRRAPLQLPPRGELERCLADALLGYADWIDRNLAAYEGDGHACTVADRQRLAERATRATSLVGGVGRLFDAFDLLRDSLPRGRAAAPRAPAGLPAGWDADAVRLAVLACAVQHDQLESMAALGEALLVDDPEMLDEIGRALLLIGWTRAYVSQAGCALSVLRAVPSLDAGDAVGRDRWRMTAMLAMEPSEPLFDDAA